jgi:carboxymethylenebutenolidase
MRPAALALLALLAGAVGVPATDAPPAGKLPPSEETAKERLNSSPRHGEWATIDAPGAPVRTWVVYPETKDKAPVVVVIHEIFGLTDWVRAVADQLAADGFIAVAPDLLSGKGKGGGGTDAFASRDDVVKAVAGLPRSEVAARLDAVRKHAIALPAANGHSASIGFCWGGATSFAWAMKQPDLDAAVVYYGPAPQEPGAIVKIAAPVLGLYGGSDERVNATIEPTRRAMTAVGNRYDTHVFDGAGHGFLRAQGGLEGANLRATEKAWPLTIAFLDRHTR